MIQALATHLWDARGNPSTLPTLLQASGKARVRSSPWSLTALFRWICNLEVLETEVQETVECIQKEIICLQARSIFLSHSSSEARQTRRTLLLTASGSGELEGGTVAGGWIFLLSAGVVLTDAVVRLPASAELIVSLTMVLDVFRRLIN